MSLRFADLNLDFKRQGIYRLFNCIVPLLVFLSESKSNSKHVDKSPSTNMLSFNAYAMKFCQVFS